MSNSVHHASQFFSWLEDRLIEKQAICECCVLAFGPETQKAQGQCSSSVCCAKQVDFAAWGDVTEGGLG